MTVNNDISEEFQYDISYQAGASSFDLTGVAYDIAFNDVPFILKSDNQNPYRRETAQYKKDQFDNSTEPGEQSLTGWWVRSQTSWHNGAGIEFYEPGTDYQHVSHRFKDSRGIDVWTVGELRLHKDVFHGYTGAEGINAASGNDGTMDVLVAGDSNGLLKKISLGVTGPNGPMDTANYTNGGTYPDGHGGTDYPFYSVATDGSTYYAACSRCIHKGTIGTLNSDDIFFKHHATDTNKVLVKYAKGNVFVGMGRTFGLLNTSASPTSATHTTGAVDTFSNYMNHINTDWNWVDATGSPGPLFFGGNGGNNGEVWAATIDTSDTTPTNAINLAGASMVLSLPDGELLISLHYYLGYLALGTSKGVRICPVDGNGNPVLGPLLIETQHHVNAFTERGTYLYAATKADTETAGVTHGILIRIDLSQQFDDGTFAYAYDLEYQSSPDSSDCTEVYSLDDRLVMVIQEGEETGELQVEHTTNYRSSGWLETGKIRYGTVEPKFFKYLQTRGLASAGDSISVQTVDYAGNVYDIITLDAVSLGQNVGLNQPVGGQEFIGIKYTLTNGSPITDYPVLQSYQLKAIPGVPRQRLYQYPLSCFDSEMDKYNVQFGYSGRAWDVVQTLEELESTGDFVTVHDYRTEESFQGVIEEVRFISESSPDKDSNGFGGLLLVTVRKP